MVNNKQQYINSKLFGELQELGGQTLVAVYVSLLSGRNGYHCYSPIKNSNGKITKGLRLLSKKTGVSLSVLSSHVPTLIELGLCYHMNGGGFFMLGANKITKKYKNNSSKVPVRIGKNLSETKLGVNFVLIHANAHRQTSQIDKKITLNKALGKEAKGIHLTSKEANMILKASKQKGIELDNLKKVENIVLSNMGISKLVSGDMSKDKENSVSMGGYWRKKLEKANFIQSRKRYKTLWAERISYERFLQMKPFFTEQYGFVTYKNGRVVKPVVSELYIPNLYDDVYASDLMKKQVAHKKADLSTNISNNSSIYNISNNNLVGVEKNISCL